MILTEDLSHLSSPGASCFVLSYLFPEAGFGYVLGRCDGFNDLTEPGVSAVLLGLDGIVIIVSQFDSLRSAQIG